MFAKSCQEGTINDARSPMGLLRKHSRSDLTRDKAYPPGRICRKIRAWQPWRPCYISTTSSQGGPQ